MSELEASEEARAAFVGKFAFYDSSEIQTLFYTIPGHKGSLEAGKRPRSIGSGTAIYPQDSKEYTELMTR